MAENISNSEDEKAALQLKNLKKKHPITYKESTINLNNQFDEENDKILSLEIVEQNSQDNKFEEYTDEIMMMEVLNDDEESDGNNLETSFLTNSETETPQLRRNKSQTITVNLDELKAIIDESVNNIVQKLLDDFKKEMFNKLDSMKANMILGEINKTSNYQARNDISKRLTIKTINDLKAFELDLTSQKTLCDDLVRLLYGLV